MTTHIDLPQIEQEVGRYFRYAMLSHRWEANEPLYKTVIKIVVYGLGASPTHEKLKMFCKVVRDAGFNWAWSDTCCIDKTDPSVLQEALVSMFKWYEGSAMTVIFLRGVSCLAKRGALTKSIWNTRAWTLQEYHASKVVRIYTEEWTPYLGLNIDNFKDSPEIISEMEEATGISAQALTALRPGLDDVRVKLRLASTRQTSREEDAAYSLLGIFSMTMPVTYGEQDKALGRFLAQLLTSSGDASILAWTGRSGSFNSCLPSSITVFSQLPTSHIPVAISDSRMGAIIAEIHSLDLPTTLYDRVNELPLPSFAESRLKLPCLTFNVRQVSSKGPGVFYLQTKALGDVVIQTQEDLSRLNSLRLVHPWIDFLVCRRPVGGVPRAIVEEDTDNLSVQNELPSIPGPSNIALPAKKTLTTRFMSRIGFGGRSAPDTASVRSSSSLSFMDKQTRALQFFARLRQPFGALLLTQTRQNFDEYRRVAAESLITVRVKEFTPEILNKLMDNVKTLDVL